MKLGICLGLLYKWLMYQKKQQDHKEQNNWGKKDEYSPFHIAPFNLFWVALPNLNVKRANGSKITEIQE